MPKKTVTARGGAQRNKPKVQKGFELVRQVSDEPQLETVDSFDSPSASVSTMVSPAEVQPGESMSTVASTSTTTVPAGTTTAPKRSAAARIASQRQTSTRAQQRAAVSLVTSEHYAYVRRDLIFIAILAFIMFTAIVILHFVPGIGS
ncbi:MAG: hypothetical protein NVS4B7_08180 [Ktedonobacteraceae bacterium]